MLLHNNNSPYNRDNDHPEVAKEQSEDQDPEACKHPEVFVALDLFKDKSMELVEVLDRVPLFVQENMGYKFHSDYNFHRGMVLDRVWACCHLAAANNDHFLPRAILRAREALSQAVEGCKPVLVRLAMIKSCKELLVISA